MRNISVSKIDKFLQCPLAFKYRYLDKIPETSSMVVHAGRVVHEVIEVALKQVAQTGKYPDWQTLDDMYEPAWERQTKQEEEKESFVAWQFDDDDPPEKVKAECRPLVRLAREEALPKIRPFMADNGPVIEYRVDMEFRSDVGPFQTVGYIDLLDDTGLLSDWKTTKKVSARAKKGWLQAASYSFWVYPITGEENVRAQKIFLVRGDNPHVEYAPTLVGPPHRAWFAKLAAEVWKSIYHGVYPARSEGWWCSPKFCSFYGPCQEGIGKADEEPVKETCVSCKGSGKTVVEREVGTHVDNGPSDGGTAS